jgi:hypothetical protein
MLDSKLVKYLQDLPSKDRERFRAFVQSPFFNQHKKTCQLLDIILGHLEKGRVGVNKEKTYALLYPSSAYDEQKLHNVMSNLKKLFHRFLAQVHFEAQPLLEEVYTLEEAYERNQFDLLTNRAKQLEKQLLSYPYRDGNYHFAQYRLNYLLGYYGGQYVDRSKSDTLQQMYHHLDQYFMSEKMRNGCHLIGNSMLMNTSYDLGLLESVVRYVDQGYLKQDQDQKISIELYHNILLSLKNENDPQYYQRLKDLFATQSDKFSPPEKEDLFSFASNYCIRQINAGQSVYQKELFELYQQALPQGLVLTHGIISEWSYKNIATLGCSLKEFEWTEKFLQDYRDFLLPDRKENAYNYNLANLYYNKKKYRDALTPLLTVKYTDVKYHLSANFLLLRTYFAMRDTEALLSLIETLRIYIIRNRRITTEERRGYTNFLRFVKKLVTYKHQASTFAKPVLEEKLAALRQKIETTDNVMNRYWLLEECNGVALV